MSFVSTIEYLLRSLKRWLNDASASFCATATAAASFLASVASVVTSPTRPSRLCSRCPAASIACVLDAVRSDVSRSFDSWSSTRVVIRVSVAPTCSRTNPFVAHADASNAMPPHISRAANCRFMERTSWPIGSHGDQGLSRTFRTLGPSRRRCRKNSSRKRVHWLHSDRMRSREEEEVTLRVFVTTTLVLLAGCAGSSLPYTPEHPPPGARVSAAYQIVADRLRVELDTDGRRVEETKMLQSDGCQPRARSHR